MGAALLVPSAWDPLVELKGTMLVTDGLGPTRPSTCAISLASDVSESDGTVCELSARFEKMTSRVGDERGEYVVQGDAMYAPCTQD
jgi:hypothetical protein